MEDIKELAQALANAIAQLETEDKVEALNVSRQIISEASPFNAEPIDCVQWVKADSVIANDYNPNSVARPEMKLLEHSIRKNGFAMPIISASFSNEGPTTTRPQKVVDGFHRHKVGKTTKDISERMCGYLPVANIAGDASDQGHLMSATVEFNRARGEHSVDLMSALVKELIQVGKTDIEIATDLGMDAEEVLRLKQLTGLAGLFKGQAYSKAWEAFNANA